MNRTTEKPFTRDLLAACIAAIALAAPLEAMAEEMAGNAQNQTITAGQVEVGAGYVSDDSFKFGDYGRESGQSGTHLLINIRMSTRGDNASYMNFFGRNLGANPNWNFGINGGEQGNYGFRFEYDELSKLHSDSYQTPYTGMGTSVLTKPPVWTITPAPVGATIVTTAMMTDLAASMKRFNVETKRMATGLGLTKQLSGGWDVALKYKREEKEGAKLSGAPIQIGGQGNRGTLLAPEPINYTTGLFDAMARYADETLHMQVGYHASQFNNANRSLVFDNLFYNGASTVGGNALTGQLGQMPSNQFYQVNAAGGYNISKETRLTGSLSLGRMRQNEAFLPYITTSGILPAPPVASLNGRIDTAHADIKLSSKLTHDLNLAAGYRYDDRDNKTPINTYIYNPADNTNAAGYAGSATQSTTRRNTPLSKTQQVVYADMDYHLSAATMLRLGYDYEQIRHTYEPTDGDREHTVKAEVRHSFGETASGGLAYSHSDRNASDYNGAAPLYSTYTATYLASLCVAPNTFLYNGVVTNCTATATATSQATTPFLDTPALRKFFLADRKRDKLRAFANVSPGERLDLQVGASYYEENYPDTEAGFGLKAARGFTANFDANLPATEEVSGLFFTTVENYRTQQNGHNGASSATVPVITTLDRQNNTAAFDPLTGVVSRIDRSLTMGLGFRVKPGGSHEWGGTITRVNTRGSTGFLDVGSRLTTILPVPDAVSQLNRLELFGKYHMQKDLTLNVKYAHEKYSSTDWAWDGQTFTSSTSFIGSGQTSPDYSINMINVSFAYMF